MKRIFLLISVLAFISCSNADDSSINVESLSNTENTEEVIPKSTFDHFGIDINIELLKRPSSGSTNCRTGFGFCVTIVIILRAQQESDVPTYNQLEEEVFFVAKLVDEDKLELHFPPEIIGSPYHNDTDFLFFEVPEDAHFGDVRFLEGSYPLYENENGDFVYTIDVHLN